MTGTPEERILGRLPEPSKTNTAVWKYYALLSAFFAALTAIFAKLGVRDVVPVDKLSLVFTLVLAAVFLREPLSLKTLAGTGSILAGTLVLLVK